MHHLCRHHHHHHYHHHHHHHYFIIIFTTKPGLECRLVVECSIEFMIGFNFSIVSKRIKNSKESLIQKSSCDWVSEKILNGTYQLKHIPFLLFSYVQTDATLLANNSQKGWEMLRPFARSMVIVFFFLLWFEFLFEELNFLYLNLARSFIRGVFLIYNFAITLQSGKKAKLTEVPITYILNSCEIFIKSSGIYLVKNISFF